MHGRGRELIPLMPPPLTAADLLRLAGRRWLVVLLFGLSGLGGALTLYCASTRWYEAEIMIVPKPRAGMSSALVILARLGLVAPHSETDRIDGILRSRSVTDAVIEEFDLVRRYEVGKIEKVRKRLWSLCSTVVEKKQKVVRLRCEDEDPQVARDMADAFGHLADSGFRRVAIASAREERTFLDRRVAEAARDLDGSSQALRRFQEKHAILDLPAQGKAVIAGLAVLEGNVIARRLELSYARGFASSRESSVTQIRQQMGAITAELRALEERRSAAPASVSSDNASVALPRALEVPALRAELEALLREHKVRETLYLILTSRLEALKVDAAADVSRFIIYDHAALPGQHIRPSLRILPPGFLAGILLGVLFISRRSWWRDLQRRNVVRWRAS